MRNLLSKSWVKVGLVFMALPASMAHATSNSSPGALGLEASLEASANPNIANPVGAGYISAIFALLGL